MSTVANIFRIPELRRRILFTLGMLAVYRIGIFVTTPGVDRAAMRKYVAGQSGGFLSMFNLFSGVTVAKLFHRHATAGAFSIAQSYSLLQDILRRNLVFATIEHDFLAGLRHAFFKLTVGFVFVSKATKQATTLSGDLGRVECQALLFGHLYGNRVELCEKAAAAEFSTTDAESADQFCFVTYANLTHFDPCVEVMGQIFDQFTEIDTAISGEKEDDF